MGFIYASISATLLFIFFSIILHFTSLKEFQISCIIIAILCGITTILSICAAVSTAGLEEEVKQDMINEYVILTNSIKGIDEDAPIADKFLIYEAVEEYNDKIELHNKKNKNYWVGAFWEDCSDVPLIEIKEDFIH